MKRASSSSVEEASNDLVSSGPNLGRQALLLESVIHLHNADRFALSWAAGATPDTVGRHGGSGASASGCERSRYASGQRRWQRVWAWQEASPSTQRPQRCARPRYAAVQRDNTAIFRVQDYKKSGLIEHAPISLQGRSPT